MYKIIGADQKQYGPVSADEMRKWIAEGRVNTQTLIQAEGQTDWRVLSTYPEFASAPPPPPSGVPFGVNAPFGAMPEVKIPNYLVQSILVTLCCCLPFGVVAIIYAAQVSTKQQAGDIAGAMLASQNAKKWCWVALAVGLVTSLIGVVIQFAGLAASGFKG